jgi:hypothetical protein
MTETTKDDLGYLGVSFQQKVLWQLLTVPEFAENIIPSLTAAYFDNQLHKFIMSMIKKYHEEHNIPANLRNRSIFEYIKGTNKSDVDKELSFGTLTQIVNYDRSVMNGVQFNDSSVIQSTVWLFVKQQESKKLANDIFDKIKTGTLEDNVPYFEEKFQAIMKLGAKHDLGEDVFDNVEDALRESYREPIPTGIKAMDEAMAGGLGKGEMGLALMAYGIGKSLPLSAKILTEKGWVLNGDLKLNQNIIGSNGKNQKVLGIYPQGIRKIYTVNFNDGTKAKCDEEHIWSVNSFKQRKKHTYKNGVEIKIPDYSYFNLTTKEIINNITLKVGKVNKLNYRIPIIKPVEFNEKELPINPYVMGLLLGDGYMNSSSISTNEIEIIDQVKKIYSDVTLTKDKRKENLYRLNLQNIKNDLRKLDLIEKKSNNKFIPEQYLFNSIENRILLLNGLMDSDGYSSKTGRVQYTTVSKELSENVRELILSLGGFCKIKTKIPKFKYNGEIKTGQLAYTLTISFSDNNIKIFRLKRKQDRVIYRDKYKLNKYIESIEYSHNEEAQCIMVSNDDHLYVTNDYILTHNTTFLTKAANTAYNLGKNVLQIFFEDNVNDIKRKHYALWSKIALSELDERRIEAKDRIDKFYEIRKESGLGGRLTLKKMDQENTTIIDIKNWILNYQKTYGIKFDLIVVDYLDCIEPHKNAHGDQNKAELIVVKGFESLLSELNIPGWSAVQGNRSAVRSEFVHGDQMGGSLKRAQKTHFLFSVAKSQEQKQDNLANIQIIKSRMTKDGQSYENAIYNNDTLEIRCVDGMRPSKAMDNTKRDQPLVDPLFQNAINKIVDEQVRKKHEDETKKEDKKNSSDNQEDKNLNDGSVNETENK